MTPVSDKYVWHAVQEVPNAAGPLVNKNVASHMQKFMSTRDLMTSCFCSRGMYHAFTPQLDKRLIALFGLLVTENAKHQQVMEALRQLSGETARVITEFNALFSSESALSDITAIGGHLFRGNEYGKWQEVRFCIKAPVIPFETRTSLVELGCKLWKQHSWAIASKIGLVRKNPPLLRCLLSIGHTLQARHPEASEPKLLTALALGCLAAQEGMNVPYMAAFKARWNSLTACEQAQTLLVLTLAFYSVTELNDPVVAFVDDFLNDESLKWAFPIMQKACQQVVAQLKLAKEVPHIIFVFDQVKMVAIHALLGEIANPSNNEEAQRRICSTLQTVMDGSIHNGYPRTPEQTRSTWERTIRLIPEHASLARMANDAPDVNDIAYLLDNHAHEDDFIRAFTRYKKGWSQMTASEQARAMLLLCFNERQHSKQAVGVLYEFVLDSSLAWAHPAMRNACYYCIKNNLRPVADVATDPYYTIKDMVGVIANSSYKDDLPTVYGHLSKMIDLLIEKQDVTELINEWFTFAETLVIRKIEELSLLIPPKPSLPQPIQPQGGGSRFCALQ